MKLWPFVLRSTYDALAGQHGQLGRSCAELRGQLTIADAEHRTRLYEVETLARQSLDGYQIEVAKVATLRGYVAVRDEVIASLERSTAGMRATFESDSRAIVAQQSRIADLERQLAEATRSVERPKKSDLTQAIRDQSRRPDETIDPGLMRLFTRRARELKRQGKNESEVIEAIENGWATSQSQDAITVDSIVAKFADENV